MGEELTTTLSSGGGVTLVITLVGGLLALLVVMGLVFARMYRRSTKELSFVRTGWGGQKVIMNGGALVFPVLHDIIPVNMNTLRLEVRRADQQALITRDRMRVDVAAEFYVRVQPTADSIATAAQTLGTRTMRPDELKDLVEGKFVDALRSVAAEMAMEELHEQRVSFVQKVQKAVTEDLFKNGLELESVSLTGLDQTRLEFLNPQNAFDAEGLTQLTQRIEERKKLRNDIEQTTMVQIRQKNLEAEQERLQIEREEEYAKLGQQREIEVRKAEMSMEISKEQAEKQRLSDEAQILAKQQVDLKRIAAEREIEAQRIEKERSVREKDIERERAVETAEIERRQTVELAQQDKEIAVAERSKAQSEAQAHADQARAVAVREEEAVITVRETEVAERQKRIDLVQAAKSAERDAIAITVAAEAEKKAAEDRAAAVRTEAEADAVKIRVSAEAEADAERARADAQERRYAVEAAGKLEVNKASNVLSPEQIAMQVRLALIEHLPRIIAESAKPMQSIDEIKILQVDGLYGAGRSGAGGANDEGSPRQGNLAEQVVESALRYRTQAPLVDSLLNELGLEGGKLNGLSNGLELEVGGKELTQGDDTSA
ncbi:MAG: flotillin domain-containing protein [Myxococcota bacterium]